ncbi:hypothetical protein GCM10011339_36650 [Echinicola rosea]|uniref:Uncharacterized protein n=1 Tax=Echinicola rosea TaxID=1807691 RepID=A0ABQ1V8Y4_9BACT|nr:hypothetical protein GCM10011339_36650 [Echinicola rosea]
MAWWRLVSFLTNNGSTKRYFGLMDYSFAYYNGFIANCVADVKAVMTQTLTDCISYIKAF